MSGAGQSELDSAGGTAEAARDEASREFAALLDGRDVHVVFQPVVDLLSGEIVGVEALARGPQSTQFATPLALFAAARLSGRVGELDWVCRAAAFEAFLEADCAPAMSLFVNIEAESFATECPSDLAMFVSRAESVLRVVVEVNGRALAGDPAGVLAAVDRAREMGWGIAIDDVGVSRAPVAMLPIVQADIVKLDLRLLSEASPEDSAAIISSVLRHLEKTGASLLVEGIESEADARWACALGARYGQGIHLGAPGPLRDRYPAPRVPVRLIKVVPTDLQISSPFELLEGRAHQRMGKEPLERLVGTLVHSPRATGTWPVFLACTGRDRQPSEGVVTHFRGLPLQSLLFAIFGAGMPAEPAPGVRGVRLRRDDPLADERFLIVLSDQVPVALFARSSPDGLFDVVVTQDPDLVHGIAHHLIRRMPGPGQGNTALPVLMRDPERDGEDGGEEGGAAGNPVKPGRRQRPGPSLASRGLAHGARRAWDSLRAKAWASGGHLRMAFGSLAGPLAQVSSARTRERLGRALDATFRSGTWFAVTVVTLGIIAAWLGTYAAGGTRSVLPHAFYLPVVFAAIHFRWRGAITSAVTAGVLAGPLMPLDVSAGTAQSPAAWTGRLVVFLAAGLLVAWLSGESRRSIVTFARDARGGRELRQALERGEFAAHYQPIVDLQTRRTVGFEALCRWQDPIRGAVPPSQFIPLAERTGAIIPIDAFMLEQSARQAAAWHAGGWHDLVTAVNVSAYQLCDPNFLTHVNAALRSSGLSPQQLCVEITETAMIRDREAALSHINDLHRMGVRIALDDFGTGQSSFTYLQDFPVDVIKIDLSFVSTVDTDPKSAALVAGIVALARAIGASTVAEGIERRTQLETLRTLGCDQGQGYYLGRPGPPPPVQAFTPTPQPPGPPPEMAGPGTEPAPASRRSPTAADRRSRSALARIHGGAVESSRLQERDDVLARLRLTQVIAGVQCDPEWGTATPAEQLVEVLDRLGDQAAGAFAEARTALVADMEARLLAMLGEFGS